MASNEGLAPRALGREQTITLAGKTSNEEPSTEITSLDISPSVSDGVSEQDERKHRAFGCELIQEAGILLRLPQIVLATGQTLFHRFFSRKSFKKYDAFSVAMSSTFLAAKIEEQPKRLKEVLNVFYHLFRKRKILPPKPLELNGERFLRWSKELVMTERAILKELGFRLYNIMEHPHKYLLYYVKSLDGSRELTQKAWNYTNDSLRTDCCVRYKPQAVACAAILLSAQVLSVALPETPPWWETFEVSASDITEISTRVLALYQQAKVPWLEPLNPLSTNTASADQTPPRKPAPTESEEKVQKDQSSKDEGATEGTTTTSEGVDSAGAGAGAKVGEAAADGNGAEGREEADTPDASQAKDNTAVSEAKDKERERSQSRSRSSSASSSRSRSRDRDRAKAKRDRERDRRGGRDRDRDRGRKRGRRDRRDRPRDRDRRDRDRRRY